VGLTEGKYRYLNLSTDGFRFLDGGVDGYEFLPTYFDISVSPHDDIHSWGYVYISQFKYHLMTSKKKISTGEFNFLLKKCDQVR